VAKVEIQIHKDGIADFVNNNPEIRNLLIGVGKEVQNVAIATASAAENGSGGTIDGYAAGGFEVDFVTGSKRPQVTVSSGASEEMMTRAYWHTQRRDGVTHLRAALYSQTNRGS
jgi:hypothetical protein